MEKKMIKDKEIVGNSFISPINDKLYLLIHQHSEKLLNMGTPFSAAAVHLSIKDGYSAVIKLIRGNCLYEAYLLAVILKIDVLIKYLNCFFLKKLGKFNLLVQASRTLTNCFPDFQLMANYCINNKESLEAISNVVQKRNSYKKN